MKVLIVDDDPDLLKIMGKLLSHRGHDVQSCTTPFGVSALVLREPPDLVVLDVMMPGLDGPALAALITKLPLPKRPQIVLWSAMDEDKLRDIGRTHSLPTLAKSQQVQELAAKLEKLGEPSGSFKRPSK